MQGAHVSLLVGRPTALAHNQTCPSNHALIGHKPGGGEAIGVSGSYPLGGAVFLTEVQLCQWQGRKQCHPTLSSLDRRSHACWRSRTTTPSGGSLTILFLVLFCPPPPHTKQLHACVGACCLWWSTIKNNNQGFLPSACASVPCQWMTAHWNYRTFCHWKGPSSKCTPGRGAFSPSVTHGTSTPCCPFPGLHPSCPLEHMLWLISGKSHTLPEPQNLSSTCYPRYSVHFNSPVSGFREVFFLPEPNVLLSLPISFSLSFLSPQKGLPPHHGTMTFLSPNSYLHASYLPRSLPLRVQIILPILRLIY